MTLFYIRCSDNPGSDPERAVSEHERGSGLFAGIGIRYPRAETLREVWIAASGLAMPKEDNLFYSCLTC